MKTTNMEALFRQAGITYNGDDIEQGLRMITDRRDKALVRLGRLASCGAGYKVAESPAEISNAQTAAAMMKPFFAGMVTEEIFCCYVDKKNRPLRVESVSKGEGPAGAALDLRRLLAAALATSASGAILAHNHPSGSLTASEQDIATTKTLAGFLREIGVELVDHIIVTETSYSSILMRR